MYIAYGFPRSLNTGLGTSDGEECIYASNVTPDFVIIVFSSAVQVWSGSQHRVKLGEAHRGKNHVTEEGPNLRAHWCPQKRVLAVATSRNHLQLYGLNVSSEALWRLPDSQGVRRVNVFLSHSIHLDYGAVRIADLGGDVKSLLVALTNGTMQVFSWQGKLRGQSNPFTAAYEGSRSRRQQARTASLNLNTSGTLGMHLSPFSSSSGDNLTAVGGGSNGLLLSAAAAGLAASPSRTSSSHEQEVSISGLSSSAAGILAASDSLPLPTPTQPADVAVEHIHYAPAARMLAVVLHDGRCALCRTADSGIHPAEQLQLFRWVYKPAGPESPLVVAAALNPIAQLLALGLSNSRVVIHTLQSLLSVRHLRSSCSSKSQEPSATDSGAGTAAAGTATGGYGGGSGQPEPTRVLSLADWGYRSTVVGPASVLRWSPDGRVIAVGYEDRGIAVWTPSGCRLMCSLRQAVATSIPGASAVGLASAGMQMSTASPLPPPSALQAAAAAGDSSGEPVQRGGHSPGGSSHKLAGAPVGLWSQNSNLNPSQAPEPGVLEGGVSALTWSSHGYQLLVAEAGQARCLHQLEFARYMHGSHRVVQQAAGAGAGPGPGLDEVQALQAADRVLLISEARQTVDPSLRVTASTAAEAAEGDAAGLRPDLSIQHVKLPQLYIEAAYPLLHASISHDCADVAVAGTRGLALYSRRARRWRLFGDATQERSLRVQGLMWLPGGIVAACAYVDGKEGGGAPQLLLYPQYHLDNASLLARLPLKQVPVAMDSVGWHMVLAFAPLEIRLFRVTVDRSLGPSGRPIARLTALRELSIMGLGNPLQEIALVDPSSPASHSESSGTNASQLRQNGSQEQAGEEGSGGSGGANPTRPQLKVATKPRPASASTELGPAGTEAPLQCVMLRAGGIMSKLDLQEGSEMLLSDAIERFWLPISAAAVSSAPSGGSGSLISRGSSSGFVALATGVALAPSDGDMASLSTSSSLQGLGWASSESELPTASAVAPSCTRMEQQQQAALVQHAQLEGVFQLEARQPPRVEMPWWTYGARGMQLWFPSSLSEPLTPSLRSLSLTSPTTTGLAAAATPATNSTDPELEFDREVYPIGVSLAEVSIVGVVQRTARSQAFPPEAAQSLCFHPLPESQPVLPCLLRRLLQKGRTEDALELARWHSGGPHFNRSLEWLLFTALENDAEHHTAAPVNSSPHGGARPARQRFSSSYAVTVGGLPAAEQLVQQQAAASSLGSPPCAGGRAAAAAAGRATSHSGLVSPHSVGVLSAAALAQWRAGPLLVAAARLISQFPQFPEIVVSVARKTDAALWPSLFAAVGSPARMCQGLMQTDKLQNAACCLVIVEQIEGSAQAQAQALQLIRAALQVGQYGLATDLLRFLVPPGKMLGVHPTLAAFVAANGGLAAARGARLLQQQEKQQQSEETAAAVEAAQQQPQQREYQASSWFWGLFGGEAPAPAAASTPSAEAQLSQQQPRQAAAAATEEEEEEEGNGAAATEAWRMTAQHAWRLLDSGALREATQLARSLAELHGGLPALLVATAGEAPEAAAHLTPSAAAIASALFVAANEFALADQELEAARSAEQLLAVCQEVGCVNLAAALALLLGDQGVLQEFMGCYPAVWADLHSLIANDVHLCGYAPVLSPLPSPMTAAHSLGPADATALTAA